MSTARPPNLLTAKFQSLLLTLHALHDTHSTRRLLLKCYTLPYRYCPLCSPNRAPGSCGPTCQLLNPHPHFSREVCPEWMRDIRAEWDTYCQIRQEMEECWSNMSRKNIREWKKRARVLVWCAMSELERRAASGWRESVEYRKCTGMNLEWTWGNNEAKKRRRKGLGGRRRSEDPVGSSGVKKERRK
ncbi:hypothetical protein BDU57DRAFT_22521 [Ampelomyces quisqualis]|uniref:Uncharacterized protein n=1 Tax=Ampelomyces quisqualis TaxID=50730 RepID=A0A6A5QZ18_AMPQU|nr:hypothetical protein BDU57DRAFT_22521 [Ampelomyces quisqualis]